MYKYGFINFTVCAANTDIDALACRFMNCRNGTIEVETTSRDKFPLGNANCFALCSSYSVNTLLKPPFVTRKWVQMEIQIV